LADAPLTAPARTEATPDRSGRGVPRRDARQRPARPDPAPPTSGAAPASAAAAGLAGGLALLVLAVSLAGPHLRRRLSIDLAALRPVAFVSLLERPG
ncbi:MAG: hypothetical protein QOE60_2124, partial [Thermoleophilaceae bacterium]|nr:hypothetical protein [Thermoleophilaceae bacterium]